MQGVSNKKFRLLKDVCSVPQNFLLQDSLHKLCRLQNKKTTKQTNLTDGRTFFWKSANQRKLSNEGGGYFCLVVLMLCKSDPIVPQDFNVACRCLKGTEQMCTSRFSCCTVHQKIWVVSGYWRLYEFSKNLFVVCRVFFFCLGCWMMCTVCPKIWALQGVSNKLNSSVILSNLRP